MSFEIEGEISRTTLRLILLGFFILVLATIVGATLCSYFEFMEKSDILTLCMQHNPVSDCQKLIDALH